MRRAGFEFEFGNLPIRHTVESLHRALGGEIEHKTPFEAILHDSKLGKLKVERDADVLKSVRYRRWLESLGVEFDAGSIGELIEGNIDYASKTLIPCEVVTDPIPFDRLETLDELVSSLNAIGAEGTQDSLLYAFGLHINPEIPDAEASTLAQYLQAYLLLAAWIIESSRIDLTRRYLTKYVDPFPKAYMELVLDHDYKPDMTTLISDYLAHNPTRNRALDMLPILVEIDRDQVLGGVNEDERKLITGRPAFHYRLPDCRINSPNWTPATAWNAWVYVEKLASDAELRSELIAAWCEAEPTWTSFPQRRTWAMQVTTILSRKYFEGA